MTVCAPESVLSQGLGMFTSQSVASVTLGASIAAAGIVGTPIGGWLLDWEVNRRWKRVQSAQSVTEGVSVSSSGLPVADQEDGASSTAAVTSCPHEKEEVVPEALLALRLQVAMRQVRLLSHGYLYRLIHRMLSPPLQSFLLTVAGTIMCFFAVAAALSGPGLFMFFLSIGFALLLANTSALAVATMACVPAETRAFAIGLNTLMIHAFGAWGGTRRILIASGALRPMLTACLLYDAAHGAIAGDVPSPPLIGLVADTLSPKVRGCFWTCYSTILLHHSMC